MDHSQLEQEGRPFRCSSCIKDPARKGSDGKPAYRETIMLARRCQEDRWNFTEADGRGFPIQVTPGGPTFGFCPAKITRDDPETLDLYQNLIAILETGTWPKEGGLEEQDAYWVELVAEIGPMRRQMEFVERMRMVGAALTSSKKRPHGGGQTSGGMKPNGPSSRTPPPRGRG